MSERIVLLTIRRENETGVELLVRGSASSWSPVTAERDGQEFPVETAVRAGEDLFGPESVCSLWLLGKIPEAGSTSHYFCLDLDAVAVNAPLPEGFIWIGLDEAAHAFTGAASPLFEKLHAYRAK